MTLKYIPRGIIKQVSNHSKTHKDEKLITYRACEISIN